MSASCSCTSVNSTAPSQQGGFRPRAWSRGFSSCSMTHKGACHKHALSLKCWLHQMRCDASMHDGRAGCRCDQ